LILILGCYFILNFIMFAQFIEEPKGYKGVAPLEKLEKEMLNSLVKAALRQEPAQAAGLDLGLDRNKWESLSQNRSTF
jgi:hypothetical protein